AILFALVLAARLQHSLGGPESMALPFKSASKQPVENALALRAHPSLQSDVDRPHCFAGRNLLGSAVPSRKIYEQQTIPNSVLLTAHVGLIVGQQLRFVCWLEGDVILAHEAPRQIVAARHLLDDSFAQ